MLKLEKLLLIFTNPKRFSKGLVRYFNWFVLENLVRITSFMIFNMYHRRVHTARVDLNSSQQIEFQQSLGLATFFTFNAVQT